LSVTSVILSPTLTTFTSGELYIAFREGVKDKPLSYICFEILYWTGMRKGELLALSPADIDLDNKTIPINRTYQRIEEKDVFTSPKTRKSKRKIPIPDFLCQKLSDYIQSRYMLDADERLFPITKSYLSHEMIRGCKNTGVKKIRIHDIRHPYVKPTTKKFITFFEVFRAAS
ncbi:site-specific integrase, partial [Ruminococcus sp.]|uniref:site-specific integrase n=1 Tax=Ruminococcus sp. TaxID=41978 RepID=UPI002E773543